MLIGPLAISSRPFRLPYAVVAADPTPTCSCCVLVLNEFLADLPRSTSDIDLA
jgi:hypothetical protein